MGVTATDELRRLLDERGVEHYDGTERTLWGYEDHDELPGIYRFSADETSGGRMQVRLWHATPAQAIEATLGRGTCHKLPASGDKTCIVRHNSTHLTMECGYWRCSECGCECFEGARYCMGCGAKVVGV